MTNETCRIVILCIVSLFGLLWILLGVRLIWLETEDWRVWRRRERGREERERDQQELDFCIAVTAAADARALKFEQDAHLRAAHERSHINILRAIESLQGQLAAKPTKKSKS